MLIKDIDLVIDLFSKKEYSFIIVKNGSILLKQKEVDMKSILETVDKLQDDLNGSTVGINILDKATALLFVYSKIAGIYSPRSTKKALAVLIRAGIPGQTDEIVMPSIIDRDMNYDYEEIVTFIDSPDYAYEVLKEKIQK